jgi:bifunctional non-homologous end joining protein LigD
MPRRRPSPGASPPPAAASPFVRPMLASPADRSQVPLASDRLVYERKYDGMRALAACTPGGPRQAPGVTIWTRSGADRTAQFPEVAAALAALARTAKRSLLLDGEIVALDHRGDVAGFARLQPRLSLTGERAIAEAVRRHPTAFVAFDLLRDGDEDLVSRPWTTRRARLEGLLRRGPAGGGSRGAPVVRLSDATPGDGHRALARAIREGWEGLVVKAAWAPYEPGRRSRFWRKVKLERRQEFVVGGFTEGRDTRRALGALLVGVWEAAPRGARRLRFAGRVGTGFDRATLTALAAKLRSLETRACPFDGPVDAPGRPHWIRPSLVVEVRYAEWTPEGRLRHPVYLGWREDKAPGDVVSEATPRAGTDRVAARTPAVDGGVQAPAGILDRLHALEETRRNGWVDLPDGTRVYVTHLWKPFWPALGLTKGDVLRYYVEVAPFILPALRDRPLVLQRLPDGIAGPVFYQQRARPPVPAGVRVERLPEGRDPARAEDERQNPWRFVGGSLATLIYTAQLGAVSQDPWFSTVTAPLEPDQAALDLDPGPEATWSAVLDVARWVRDELARLGLAGVPKTSGSRGLHVYVPLPPRTSYESALLVAQLVATLVAARHPGQATVERAVARRPPRAVYVDYLQNLPGKTLASPYSARASAYAGVSTPLAWHELDAGVDARDFTIRTALARFREVGDLWAELRTSPRVDLRDVLARAARLVSSAS